MRAILIAVSALAVLTTTAQAQVDHIFGDFAIPACVTPYDYDRAFALWQSGRPIDPHVCIMLKGGTEVIPISRYGGYQRIIYSADGRDHDLFIRGGGLASEVCSYRKATGMKDDEYCKSGEPVLKDR
jgi:hypothetical protein